MSVIQAIQQCNDLDELLEAKKLIDQQLTKVRKSQIADARKQVKQLADNLGVPVSKLLSNNGNVKSGATKYVNPNNPAQSWGGRGKKPTWLIELLGKGIELDSLKQTEE